MRFCYVALCSVFCWSHLYPCHLLRSKVQHGEYTILFSQQSCKVDEAQKWSAQGHPIIFLCQNGHLNLVLPCLSVLYHITSAMLRGQIIVFQYFWLSEKLPAFTLLTSCGFLIPALWFSQRAVMMELPSRVSNKHVSEDIHWFQLSVMNITRKCSFEYYQGMFHPLIDLSEGSN